MNSFFLLSVALYQRQNVCVNKKKQYNAYLCAYSSGHVFVINVLCYNNKNNKNNDRIIIIIIIIVIIVMIIIITNTNNNK